MAYNYGTVGLASVTSGSMQLVACNTAYANTAVRVFDVCCLNTASSVSLYAGTSSAVANLILIVDKNNMLVHSDAGYRFIGGVWAVAGGNTALTNFATVNYINEM